MSPLQYSALEHIHTRRPVRRLEYLQRYAKGKFVFDLGALDETAYRTKRTQGNWLHARLCTTASRVVGFDNSALVPGEGIRTAENGLIVNWNIFQLEDAVERYGRPDLIVAGELIEHLPDTSALLTSLRKSTSLSGTEFVFSTPNACSWHNAVLGLVARESTHRDHLQIYSYKTLRTLFHRSDVELTALQPYFAQFPEMIGESTGLKKAAVAAFERVVNALEFAAPLMSAGWIGHARI